MKAADSGIAELSKYVDSLITIPNQKLLTSLGKNVSLLDAFKAANNVLLNAVQGIAELITRPGLINVDFADVRTVMSGMGVAMMGMGKAQGEDRAAKAAQAAISSPLLEDICLDGAKGILVNITAGLDMGIHEFEEVGEVVRQFASPEATVVVGTVIDPEMRDEIRVTLVATGLEEMGAVSSTPPSPPLRAVEPVQSRASREKERVRQLQPVQLEPMPKVSVGKGGRYENVLDVPPIYRQGVSEGNLDIPAFLRKQAD